MADGDDGPQHHYKRFRGDYGKSEDEYQQSHPSDEVESVNQHRSPQQQIYLPSSSTQHRLRFPENRTDESYLVLDPEVEEPVKSKPRGATAMHRPSDTSSTETTATTDHSSSDAGVTVGYQHKPRRRSPKKRSRAANDDTRDDDTGSERNEIVESREVNIEEVRSPINSQRAGTGRIRHGWFCNGVSKWRKEPHCSPITLPIVVRLSDCGVQVINFQLHCRGLDEDFNQRYATLTAIARFLPKSHTCQRLLNYYDCTVKLTVEVFEESVEHGKKLGTASTERQLKCDERDRLSMPITVYRVVDLDHIVYSDTCPDVIFFRMTVNLDATRIPVRFSESGMDDFLEVSVSSM